MPIVRRRSRELRLARGSAGARPRGARGRSRSHDGVRSQRHVAALAHRASAANSRPSVSGSLPSGARASFRPRPPRGRSAPSRRGARRRERGSRLRRSQRSAAPPRRGGASRGRRPPRRGALLRPAPGARALPALPPAASRRGRASCRSRCRGPRRSRPHAASTTASRPRSPRLRSRVSMLPRSGSTDSVGSSARSCALRRADAVPIRMPGRISDAPHSASRGSSLAGYAPTASPAASVEVMSLAECTATSMRPSRSASSSSLTKTPRLPISPNGRVRSRSPAVVIGTSAISRPGRRSASAARSAWVSASLLPREPTRRSTVAAGGVRRRDAARPRPARPNADEGGGHDERQRPSVSDSLARHASSSSASPNRWRTTSA